jgi:hypothetical protein
MYQVDINQSQKFLTQLIQENNLKAAQWLNQKTEKFAQEFNEKDFFLAFVGAPRFTGKTQWQLTDNQILEAERLRKGFRPQNWAIDQTSRVVLLLALPTQDENSYLKILDKLFETAEVSELVALYASLPLLPLPHLHINRASEGIRTNIAPVFEAVALNNPYPMEYFSETAWNQLFLKAIFTGKKIWQIEGVAERANADLARICSDYAHERWAAGRLITPELWMPVGKFVNELIINDLIKLFQSDNHLYQLAATLVCQESEHPEAKKLLVGKENLLTQIKNEGINWEKISQKWWEMTS